MKPIRILCPLPSFHPPIMLLVILSLMILPAARASAEIIDFDPNEDDVHEILDVQERALLETLTDTSFVYVTTEPSPSGRWALAYLQGQQQLIDLESGETLAIPKDTPGWIVDLPNRLDIVMAASWLDDDVLGVMALTVYPAQDEDSQTVIEFHRASIDLGGDEPMVGSEHLNAMDDIAGHILSFSPDLTELVLMRAAGGGGDLPEPIRVTLGDSPYDRAHDLPDDAPSLLPNVVGAHPLGVHEVQQAAFELVLMAIDGSNERVIDLSGASGDSIASVGFSPDGTRLHVLTRSMPDWDGDRQRDNYPPGDGLPSLGSVNVREALGQIAPQDNPLVWGSFLNIVDVDDGSLVKTFANSDFPQGLIADFTFSPSSESALLVLATRSELEGRQHPTYAFPSGIEVHLLDNSLEFSSIADCEGCDSLSTYVDFVDDDRLAFVAPAELDHRAFTYDVRDGSTSVMFDERGAIYQAFPRPGGLLYSATNIDRPLELYRFGELSADGNAGDRNAGQVRQLTGVNSEASRASNITFHDVSWPTSDGHTMTGIIVHHDSQVWPPAEPWPLVVWQQGGPGGQMVNDWGGSVEAPYSLLPNLGIPVLIVNAAGRTVKDNQFYNNLAEGRNFGQVDITQVKEGVDALVEMGYADGDRIGITGCSYGGYFALQSIRTYPQRYAAANPQCSLVDLFEEFTFGFAPVVSYLMGRTPFDDPDEYLADSPLFGSKEMTTPTLLFHGTDDFLPVQLINNLHDQLEANGTPVTFLRVSDEGHGLGWGTSQAQAAQMQVAFFRERFGLERFEPPQRFTIHLPTLSNNHVIEEAGY